MPDNIGTIVSNIVGRPTAYSAHERMDATKLLYRTLRGDRSASEVRGWVLSAIQSIKNARGENPFRHWTDEKIAGEILNG